MTREELLRIVDRVRGQHGRRAEDFALRMIRHFEADINPAAEVWRSVHECLKYVLVPQTAVNSFDHRQSAQAQRFDQEAC